MTAFWDRFNAGRELAQRLSTVRNTVSRADQHSFHAGGAPSEGHTRLFSAQNISFAESSGVEVTSPIGAFEFLRSNLTWDGSNRITSSSRLRKLASAADTRATPPTQEEDPLVQIRISPAGIELIDSENWRAFSVAVPTSITAEQLPDLLATAGIGELDPDGDHVHVSVKVIRELAAGRVSSEWDDGFAAMLTYVGSNGRLDASGTRIRAHIERVESTASQA